jgi:hypothetical protein
VCRRVDALAGPRALILDGATVPLRSTIAWNCDEGPLRGQVGVAPPLPLGISRRRAAELLAERPAGNVVELAFEDVAAIWLRRPRRPLVHPRLGVPELRRFAGETSAALFESLLAAVPVHNDPAAEHRATQKLYQLLVAQRCGLAIPRTLVTTDPERAAAFVGRIHAEGREVVYKTNVFGRPDGPPTRVFVDEDWERIADVALCPTTFQERVRGGPDLRVAIVGMRPFAAEWRAADGPSTSVDVRLDDARMWRTTLEPSLERRLLALHAALGLSLGVYDLKIDARLGPVFLECNVSGQWLDLETEAGHPVSEALARLLVSGAAAAWETALPPFGDDDLLAMVDELAAVR